ncbi:hypothetical protein BGZ81_007896 [Podila clonocystis]|nr:hypothetical protein BGZ81_007896 [Podila clonocystis]
MSTATMHQTPHSHPKGPTHNGLFKGASLNTISTTLSSRPSSPRLQQSHQPYPNNKTSQAAAKVQSTYASRPSSPSPSTTSAKGLHTYSPSYPHASIHPPLRLLTTATCIETITSLVSAQSPPQSPTFSSFGLAKSSSTSSRANSILDGIQSALVGGGLSAPTSSSLSSSSIKVPVASSSYSAAKDSLADFSIPPSKRITNSPEGHDGPGVIRSRSNYVSFPNFDEIDFVDVSMVHNYEVEERAEQDGEEDEEDEEDDQPAWSEPGSLPDMSLHDDRMRAASIGSMGSTGSGGQIGMPLSPSQHWLLQLETYHELRVNGVEV